MKKLGLIVHFLLSLFLVLQTCNSFSHDNQFLWKHETSGEKWSTCSATCGSGIQRRILYCYDVFNEVRVDDAKCKKKLKPTTTKTCALTPCENRYEGYWFETEWGDCTVTCGRGIQSRLIACINHAGTEILDNSKCHGAKPQDYKECRKPECVRITYWKTGPWSKCSSSCNGKEKRKVTCRFEDDDSIADENLCKKRSKKPQTRRHCGSPCERWIAGEWGKCKYNKRRKLCTMAKQIRCVLCIDTITLRISKKCSTKTKPIEKRSCAFEACSKSL